MTVDVTYDIGNPGAAPRRRVTLDELRAHRDEIYRIASRYGVSNIRVFGSVSRGEASGHSDLDLVIDVARGHGYFDMSGFALEVEQLLHVFTQVVTPNGIRPAMREHILAEAVTL